VLKPEKRAIFFLLNTERTSQGLEADSNHNDDDDPRLISIPLHLQASQDVLKSQLSIMLLAGRYAVECEFTIQDQEKGTGNVRIPWDTPPGNYRLKISSALSPFTSGYSAWFCLKRESLNVSPPPPIEEKESDKVPTAAAAVVARIEKAGEESASQSL